MEEPEGFEPPTGCPATAFRAATHTDVDSSSRVSLVATVGLEPTKPVKASALQADAIAALPRCYDGCPEGIRTPHLRLGDAGPVRRAGHWRHGGELHPRIPALQADALLLDHHVLVPRGGIAPPRIGLQPTALLLSYRGMVPPLGFEPRLSGT